MNDFHLDISDAIIPIVAVIIWIVSSVMKSNKKAPRGDQDPVPSTPPQDFGSPDDPEVQLRRFLHELSGTSDEEEEPEPVTAIQDVREEPAPRIVPPPPPRHVVAATPPPLAPPPQEVPVRVTRPEAPAVELPAVVESSPIAMDAPLRAVGGRSLEIMKRLRTQLQRPESVRHAIVLREVLGPPIAMRQQGQ